LAAAKIRKLNFERPRSIAATRFPEPLSALRAGCVLERFLGLAAARIFAESFAFAARKFLDEFLARSLRRRAG
jgi:hypothetical protein